MLKHIFTACVTLCALICIQEIYCIEFMSQGSIRRKRDINQSTVVQDLCGTTVQVNSVDNFTFTLDSNKTYCRIGFIGSHTEECTTKFQCTALHFDSGNDPKAPNCKNYIKLTDGLQGYFKTCSSTEEFRKFPYKASNHGKDLYLKYKGPIKGTCTVSCAENQERYPFKQVFKTLDKGPLRNTTEGGCGEHNKDRKAAPLEGYDAVPHEFPWMAALVFPGTRELFCSGTLINDRYIVTSAHCLIANLGEKGVKDFKPTQFQVLLHSYDLKVGASTRQVPSQKLSIIPSATNTSAKKKETSSEKSKIPDLIFNATDLNEGSLRLNVKNVTLHPFYNYENLTAYDYDIAIIELAKPVDVMGSSAKPICLPTGDKIFHTVEQTGTVAGWGRTISPNEEKVRKLQKLEVSLLGENLCSDFLRARPRLLCGGYLEPGKDACADAGGPLMYRFADMKYRLIGIVSVGIGCSETAGLIGFYTNIQEVIQWIYKMTEDGVWCN